jgi:uncharacterized membrane protein
VPLPTPAVLFINLLAGVIGAAYFIYGKKQARMVPMVAGVLLCVYPWFFDSVLWLVVIGLALVAAPFVIDY